MCWPSPTFVCVQTLQWEHGRTAVWPQVLPRRQDWLWIVLWLRCWTANSVFHQKWQGSKYFLVRWHFICMSRRNWAFQSWLSSQSLVPAVLLIISMMRHTAQTATSHILSFTKLLPAWMSWVKVCDLHSPIKYWLLSIIFTFFPRHILWFRLAVFFLSIQPCGASGEISSGFSVGPEPLSCAAAFLLFILFCCSGSFQNRKLSLHAVMLLQAPVKEKWTWENAVSPGVSQTPTLWAQRLDGFPTYRRFSLPLDGPGNMATTTLEINKAHVDWLDKLPGKKSSLNGKKNKKILPSKDCRTELVVLTLKLNITTSLKLSAVLSNKKSVVILYEHFYWL